MPDKNFFWKNLKKTVIAKGKATKQSPSGYCVLAISRPTAERFRFKEVIPGIDRYQRLANAIDWLDSADLIIKILIANVTQLPLKAYSKESLFKILYAEVRFLQTTEAGIIPIEVKSGTSTKAKSLEKL